MQAGALGYPSGQAASPPMESKPQIPRAKPLLEDSKGTTRRVFPIPILFIKKMNVLFYVSECLACIYEYAPHACNA